MQYKYFSIIAKICSLMLVISAGVILTRGLIPVVASHPESDFTYNSIVGLQIFFQIISTYCSLVFGLLLANRSRIIWYIALVLIIIICIGNIIFWTNSIILYFYLGTLVLLLISKEAFDQDLFVSYIFLFVFGFLIFALIYGTIGTYLFRVDFSGINSIYDALYFTIVTYSTVGYGDIFPKTVFAKFFVMSMIVIGLIVFATSITVIAYNINRHLKKVLNHLNKGRLGMTNHIILIGYGIFSRILIQRYIREKVNFVVIDADKNLDYERQQLMDNNRLLIVSYHGHNDSLVKAQAELAAKIIIAYETDEASILATMNTREYLEAKNPQKMPEIIVRIFFDENISKAKRAGADEVIAPHILAAQQILKRHEK